MRDSLSSFLAMERADERQVVALLKGEVIKDFIYSFKNSKGKEVLGLSKVGVDNACMAAAKKGEFFRVIGMPEVKDKGDYIEVLVKVGRFTLGKDGKEIEIDSCVGAKRQWKLMRLASGRTIPDPFYFEKALSKAERNGKRKLLPEKLIARLLKEYKKKGKIKEVN
ncbi:hypothetical protein KAW65_06095 [candidate division WOR-3 bacterium]|nr:hypothetical protein [candidate division WOR-3 bacterium]